MDNVETAIVSHPVQNALASVAKFLRWGTIVVEIKDGKVVMARVQKDIKVSTN